MWGVKGGEAGTRVSCASQECLVWPGWALCDWAVTHRGRSCPSPAQHCIQPPLHPSAGSSYTHSWHSSRLPSPCPHPAQFIPWHCHSHLRSTSLQTKAAEGQHLLIMAVPVVFCPWKGARVLFGPVPAAMHQHQLQPHVEQTAGPVCALISLRAASIFQSYYLVLKVQRGSSELPVIPNIHGKVNNISCRVFSCNSFDMNIVNLR